MTKPTRLLVRNAAIPVQRIVHRAGRDAARIAIHHRHVLSVDVVIIIRDQEDDDDDDERASKSPRRRNSTTEQHRASSTTQ